MIIAKTKVKLESLDLLRDRLLSPFIRRCWPKFIIPNYLTFFRMVSGIILAFLLFFGFKEKAVIASIFCFALLSDLFDGSVARALNMRTKIGAIMDPIADRFLIIPVAIYSLYGNYKWLLFTIIGIEIINILNVLYQKARRVSTETNIFAKIKMFLQSIAFGVILLVWPRYTLLAEFILWLSILFAIAAIFAFYQRYGLVKTKK